MEGIRFVGWDLGGHEAVRNLWEDYVCEASAVMFLIDASDVDRLEESAIELDALVSGDEDEEGGGGILNGVPLAIMLNKCDLERAQGNDFIADRIEFGEVLCRHGEGMVKMFRMSVVRGEGYTDAFRWIASFL